MIKDKLKFVAIGKTKVIIKKNGMEIEYTWLDVEEITLNRLNIPEKMFLSQIRSWNARSPNTASRIKCPASRILPKRS
jgi:hypothetical protein